MGTRTVRAYQTGVTLRVVAQHPHRGHHGATQRATANQTRPSNGTAVRRKSVLVVEDHASIGGLIAALVRQEGYRVQRAWDVIEATRYARGRAPDLVVLDVNLTYAEGFTLLRLIKEVEPLIKVPLVLVAGERVTIRSDDELLVTEVVRKPFDPDVLLNAFRRAMGETEQQVMPRHYDGQDLFLNGF